VKHKEGGLFPARQETLRRQIIAALQGQTISARDLSVRLSLSEREVYEHLEHIHRSTRGRQHRQPRLVVTAAQCNACGFVFSKRERVTKPGKCPVCRGTSIREPLFSLDETWNCAE
jgi:predicted Zn-ribbon and HTH transcriptional regulator